MLVIRIWLLGGLTGLSTSILFFLVHNVLTIDQVFHFWEFVIALFTPAIAGMGIAIVSKASVFKAVAIAYMTFLIPVLGAQFGASGSEPLWQFGFLGVAGGLVWATPFVLWALFRRKKH